MYKREGDRRGGVGGQRAGGWVVRKHMHLFQAIRCGFCDFVAAARQLMRINELLICVCEQGRGKARRGVAGRAAAAHKSMQLNSIC